MNFKPGVPEDLHVNMVRLLPVIDYISIGVCDRPAIITSTTDGKHLPDSLHYKGLAVDLRTRDLSIEDKQLYFSALKFALRKLCDVVLETDHIHVEYSPSDH